MLDAPYVYGADGFCYVADKTLLTTPGLTPWWGQVDERGCVVPGTEPEPLWAGRTVVCMASGPSLTPEDVGLVRGFTRVVSNDTWRLAPDADALYAADIAWWQVHHDEVPGGMARWTGSVAAARQFDLNLLQPDYGVSGVAAIMLAARLGAATVILLGHDCSLAHGSHWHGDHTRTGNPRAQDPAMWQRQYRQVATQLEGRVKVLNCSRYTEVECFSRVALDKAMECSSGVVE